MAGTACSDGFSTYYYPRQKTDIEPSCRLSRFFIPRSHDLDISNYIHTFSFSKFTVGNDCRSPIQIVICELSITVRLKYQVISSVFESVSDKFPELTVNFNFFLIHQQTENQIPISWPFSRIEFPAFKLRRLRHYAPCK